METIYQEIARLGRKYGAEKIVLFGSRARKDNRANSDIDMAIFGMPEQKRTFFWNDIDNLPTLLKFDIVHISEGTDTKLLNNIEKEGVILMNKLEEKQDKLMLAVSRLKESLLEYEQHNSDTVRDGVIQRFEFCTELVWKTLREYLLDQGYTEINSPKSVMRTSYEDGVIKEEAAWISLLNDRNSTSHIYDEQTAIDIFKRIKDQYVNLFDEIIERLK
ncbi:MAG: HI0074 family nucleotidyltransferase substrate-binding subunit [Aminipila sp.]